MSTKDAAVGAASLHHSCVCKDAAKCEQRRLKILHLFGPNHVWTKNGGFQEIRYRGKKAKNELINETLRLSCNSYLKVPLAKRSFSVYRVASIHFPVALLEGTTSRNKALTAQEAEAFDQAAGYTSNRIKDNLNKIGKRMSSRFISHMTEKGSTISKKDKLDIENLYVQGPVHPQNEIDTLIAQMERKAMARTPRQQQVEDHESALDEVESTTSEPKQVDDH